MLWLSTSDTGSMQGWPARMTSTLVEMEDSQSVKA